MKKLLIATDNFLPRWDGISRFLSEIIPHIKDQYDITILAPRYKGNLNPIPKVKIVRFPTYKFSVGDYSPAKFHFKEIKEHVEKADLVFTQTIGPIGALAVFYAHKLKKPVIAYIHSIEWELVAKSISPRKFVEHLFYFILIKAVMMTIFNN